jgi:putative component of membrane protein insertase Oxa1/YidC/SpoIIIJ protein YidD
MRLLATGIVTCMKFTPMGIDPIPQAVEKDEHPVRELD